MSERLITVAEMLGRTSHRPGGLKEEAEAGVLSKYSCVADVGCDHAYVSVYLVQRGIAESAIAMDVRMGPLSMAVSNIAEQGVGNLIDVRLSDGLAQLKKGEAQALVMAGMGGRLMMTILDKDSPRELGIRTAVFQPQSDIELFRQYLRDEGYIIEDEKVVFEDGKYYFPMRVSIWSEGEEGPKSATDRVAELFSEVEPERILRICNRYGEHNILHGDPLLKAYLQNGKEVSESIIKELDRDTHPERYAELSDTLSDINILLDHNLFFT